jgi:hypothetical protein
MLHTPRFGRPRPAPLRIRLAGTLLLTAVVGILGLACGRSSGGGTIGSGRGASETRAVSGFSGVELRGVGLAVVTPGGQEALTVEADDNLLAQISTTVVGDTLVLELRDATPRHPLVYRVTARQITSLASSGAGDIESEGLSGPRLRANLSGAGNIRLAALAVQTLESALAGAGSLQASGSASTLNVTMSGAGNLRARDLAARDAQIHITGAGNAVVRVSDTLRVRIAGAGNVDYLGDPRLDREILGAGGVRRIE